MDPAEATRIAVVVAYCPQPHRVDEVRLALPAGSTVADALRESGLAARHPEVAGLKVGVWGKLRAPHEALRDGDRVEVYRPLVVDPKEARRRRYRQQRG